MSELRLLYLEELSNLIYSIKKLEQERRNPSFTPDKIIKLQCAYFKLFGLTQYLEKELVRR